MYKPHTWVEIDLNNIAYNLNLIKSKLTNKSKIMGVIKADAYGFGAIEMARFLVAQDVDMLAVSVLTEGVELRKAGITIPLLLFNYVGVENCDLLFYYNLTPTVYCMQFAKELNNIAKSWNKVLDIHLNVDTGMSRLGVLLEDLPKFLSDLKTFANLNLKGVYSHFATADSIDSSYAKEQLRRFVKAKNIVIESDCKNVEFHIANSAALMRNVAVEYDYARIGAAIYGFNLNIEEGSENFCNSLKSTLSFKTIVGHTKKVTSGVSVGYGATYKTKKTTKIATLPVGYADGLRRSLSNVGEVLIKGKRAKIIGIIAMDQCMVDVTNISNVEVGDEVVIIGAQGDEEISLAEFAKLINTISYEIPVLINRRVPRYYIKNGRNLVMRGHVDNV